MRLAISHTTRYRYAQPVAHGLQRLRLKPKSTQGQRVLDWSMHLQGAQLEAEYEDHNHNRATLVTVTPGVSEVTITCAGLVDTADSAGIVGPHNGPLPLWHFLAQTSLTRPGPLLRTLVARLDTGQPEKVELLHGLSRLVLGAVRYEVGQTDAGTSAEEAMASSVGVCQDHAHIFIGAARQIGIPARYVSGYLMMDGRVEQDAGHAWAEAYVDGLGWVGFDVSNGISPDARYVRVATGADYREAAPVTGLLFGAGESELTVELAVEQQTAEQ